MLSIPRPNSMHKENLLFWIIMFSSFYRKNIFIFSTKIIILKYSGSTNLLKEKKPVSVIPLPKQSYCLPFNSYSSIGLPQWLSGKGSTWQCRRCKRRGFNPWVKEMAVCSSTLALKIPWTEEPGGLQSMGSQNTWTEPSD